MFKTRLLHSGWHLSANVNTLHSGFPVIYLVANEWQFSIKEAGIIKESFSSFGNWHRRRTIHSSSSHFTTTRVAALNGSNREGSGPVLGASVSQAALKYSTICPLYKSGWTVLRTLNRDSR
jgi:hypothetical protein